MGTRIAVAALISLAAGCLQTTGSASDNVPAPGRGDIAECEASGACAIVDPLGAPCPAGGAINQRFLCACAGDDGLTRCLSDLTLGACDCSLGAQDLGSMNTIGPVPMGLPPIEMQAPPGAPPCIPGMQSTAGMPGDPCPQQGTDCARVGGAAVTTCLPDGSWELGCMCVLPSPCGDGVLDAAAGEQCDGADLGGQTCGTVFFGTGPLACDPTTCTFDTSQCVRPIMAPPTPQQVPGCEAVDPSNTDLHANAADVLTAMSPCGFSSCHSGDGKAGLVLAGAVDLRERLVDVIPCEAPNLVLVDDSGGDAGLAGSWLWQKLTAPANSAGQLLDMPARGPTGSCGQSVGTYGARMPLAGTPDALPEERLGAIRDWICAGAPGI